MKLFLRKAHLRFYFAVLLFYFAIGYPFLLYYSQNPDKYFKKIVFLRKWIGTLSMYTSGFRVKVRFEEDINWGEGPYVICPNHSSFLDINIINLIAKNEFSYIGKEELLKNPVTRIFFKTIDITVNRNSKTSAFKAFKRADKLLKEGKSIVIFPEGKIEDIYPPEIQEFKKGLFRLATDNQSPILPVVIHDVWKIYWDDGKKYGSRPGIIHVSVLKPIPTEGIKAKEQLLALESSIRERILQTWLQE